MAGRAAAAAAAALALVARAEGARPLAAGALAAAGAVAPMRQAQADFFLLVQQWGESMCDESSAHCSQRPPANHFTIHGLWANYDNGSYPSFCDKSAPFDESKVASIEEDLDEYWPSYSGADTKFWKHEWDKHGTSEPDGLSGRSSRARARASRRGVRPLTYWPRARTPDAALAGTCASPFINSELDFFQTTLDMQQETDLYGALSDAGITPSAERKYDAQHMADAIEKAVGYAPAIHCSAAKGVGSQVGEVWLCVGTDLKFMDCPPSIKSTCSGDIAYPPATSAAHA